MEQFWEGVRLFNAGEYWHAHEQWEQCWLHATQPDAMFFQGLIQAAAALVHHQRGNPVGLQRNWAKGRPKLVALPHTMHNIALDRLIVQMDRYVINNGASATPTLVLSTSNNIPA